METISQSNNQKRVMAINEIRLNKVKEIDTEYEKIRLELTELKGKIDSILHAYCEKNGHKDILVSTRTLGLTGGHSFTYGAERMIKWSYKCAVCGGTRNYTGKGYGNSSNHKYEKIIPDDIYDDETLAKNGKTFRMMQEEFLKLKQYLDYIYSLKLKLCELFGHDAIRTSDLEHFKCKCCGQRISSQEYIETYHRAKYRGIVSFYYGSCQSDLDWIMSPNVELDLLLLTFENHQMSLELEQRQKAEEHPKTLKLEPTKKDNSRI